MSVGFINKKNFKNISIIAKVYHTAGFFSCCSVRLCTIIKYFNTYKKLPEIVDTRSSFVLYKQYPQDDVVFNFFNYYNNETTIEYKNKIIIDENNFQFTNYKDVKYEIILPFVKKYFSPCENINNLYTDLLNKYEIDFSNCVAVYYRGTDKYIETNLGSFDLYYNEINKIINQHENIKILIQSDSQQFIKYIENKLDNNKLIIINENKTSIKNIGIHYENSPAENNQDIKYLLATALIISKCKYIICNSGNVSIWIMYFRGNANNVIQYLNDSFL